MSAVEPASGPGSSGGSGGEDGLGLSPGWAQVVIERALRRGGDFAEVFAESSSGVSLRLDDQRVEEVASGTDMGASVRIVRGGTTVFGYCESLEPEAVLRLADRLSEGLDGAAALGTPLHVLERPEFPPVGVEPGDVDVFEKAAILRALDEFSRAWSAEIVQVSASYSDHKQRIWVANSRGTYATEERTRVFGAVSVVAKRGDVIQTGRETLAHRGGYEFITPESLRAMAQTAADKAVVMLDAGPAPAGRMPVVLANGFGGVLFHEACGHGLEADFIVKRTSVFAERLGRRVAEPHVTALDNGVGAGMWGSNAIDDEGTPTQSTVAISEGVLSSFLTDVLRGERLGQMPTGNSRRQGFRHLPYPRMTNTYFAPGDASPDDLIADTRRALYAKSLSGGEVDPATGDFVFGVSEGYLIEDGRVGPPVRGATLIGNGPEVLLGIDAIASDLVVKAGMCGKEGQLVPVGTGQPTLRIRELTVGGTAVS